MSRGFGGGLRLGRRFEGVGCRLRVVYLGGGGGIRTTGGREPGSITISNLYLLIVINDNKVRYYTALTT